MSINCTLVVRNGKVVDGTGAPAFVADVAVDAGTGKIVAIGPKLKVSSSARELDASGLLVCPGWIDVHTHVDAMCSWDGTLEPLSSNGVTTLVMGNCGVGFAPCRRNQRRFLMELMEGVEDIPLGSLSAGINFTWETFPEFLDALDRKLLSCDVGCLIGHGAVRAFVLGNRANLSDRPGGHSNDPITAADRTAIAECVHDAVSAGALGFSTSRTLLHRDRSGVLVPGTLAGGDELLAIGEAIAKAGGGVFELATDFFAFDDVEYNSSNHSTRIEHFGREWLWMKRVSKLHGSRVPVCFCMGMPSVSDFDPNGFRAMLREVETANADGCHVNVQVFTRPQGVLLTLDSKSHPFVESPTFRACATKAAAGGVGRDAARAALVKQLLVVDTRRTIIDEAVSLADACDASGNFGITLPSESDVIDSASSSKDDDKGTETFLGSFNGTVNAPGQLAKMMFENADWIFPWTADYEPTPELSLGGTAIREGRHVAEVLFDWLLAEDGTSVLSYLFMNYAKKNLDDTLEMLRHPATIPGLGDFGAHLGFICDAASHTYTLSHFVRDRTSGPRLSLEAAARIFALHDRGTIQVGKKADLNVIDFATLACHRPEFVSDLPRGGRRWIQTTSGYVATIVSGMVTHEHGCDTGARPGALVRNLGRANKKPPGRLEMLLSILKWESKYFAMRALLKVIGPVNLERFGQRLNNTPLQSSL